MRARFLVPVLGLVAALAQAGEFRQDLAHERYDRARERASEDLRRAPPHSAARLAALSEFLDLAIAQRDVKTDEAGVWASEAVELATALGGADDPRLAKPLAVLAARARRKADGTPPDELVRALALVEADRKNRIGAVDRAYVYQAQAGTAVEGSQFPAAVAAMERSRAAIARPADDWERVRAGVAGVLYSAYAERAGRADALEIGAAATETLRRVCGEDCLIYAFARTNLGQTRFFRGDYLGARADLDVAVRILRNWPHRLRDLGTALTVQANVVRTLGDFDAARAAYTEALRLAEQEPNDAGYLSGRMNGLGMVEMLTGHDDAARVQFERGLAVLDAEPTAPSRHYIPLLGNLGEIALRAGDVEAAEKYTQRAADLAQSIFPAHHEAQWRQRHALALIALQRGRAAQAAAALADVVADATTGYGDDFPYLQTPRCALALARARSGDDAGAWDAAVASEAQRIALVRRIAPVLSETQAFAFKRSLTSCSGLVLALAQRSRDPQRIAVAWRLVADSRGLATRLQAARLEAARRATDPAVQARWQQWERAAQAYADALIFGDGKAQTKAQARLASAEAALGESLLQQAGVAATTFDIAAAWQARPADTTLLAYIKSGDFDLAPTATSGWPTQEKFYALVLDAGATQARLIDLGAAPGLEAQAERWYRALREPESDTDELAAAGRAVRGAIWAPLALGRAGAVLWLPDGALFRLNLAALPLADAYAVERGWRFHELDNERDLLAAPADSGRERLVLLGAPDYGRPATDCGTGLTQLAGTAEEIRRAADDWNAAEAVTRLSGVQASKQALRDALPQALAAHIATHTIVLGAPCGSSVASRRGASVVASTPAPTSAPTPGVALALAGANRYYADGDVAGLLTPPEILTLPLDGLRFVVLAACDSGTGPVLAEEGVFGLRRAFRLAGARSVVMSLWPVDDRASVEWMDRYYVAVRKDHASLQDAAAAATAAVIAGRRERGESLHPYYWAAYVASGDWR